MAYLKCCSCKGVHMLKYIIKRLLMLIPVMLGVSFIVFALMNLATGDAVASVLRIRNLSDTPENVEFVRNLLHLNDQFFIRYFKWLWDVVNLNFGQSYAVASENVLPALLSRMPATLELALGGLFVMLVISLPVGILSAVYPRSVFDKIGRVLAFLGSSIPSFWLGLLLIFFFGVTLKWLPVMGHGQLKNLILPSITLGFGMAATYARLLRANLCEVLNQEYIKAAKARGIKSWKVILKHALKNSLIPLVTALGTNLGYILGGVVVVETIFSWPGVGAYAVKAIFNRDYPVVQAYVLMFALIFVVINLIVDISYRLLDPKIRKEQNR